MELDELKQMWKATPVKKNKNTDIMELIHHKTYGPVAALKRVFRKQILLMAIIPMILLATNLQDIHLVLSNILFWSYVVFCIGMIVLAWYNYKIVNKMESATGDVRTNLAQQIDLLEKRARIEIVFLRGILLFLIVLVELVPNFQHYRMLDKWHALAPVIRFGAYALLLVLQHFATSRIKQRNVGRHLSYLKELVNEMDNRYEQV